MATKKVVDISFWTDEKVVENYSPEDKYFMLYLLTNIHSNLLGIYKLSKRYVAFETGYSEETISVLLERFETKYRAIKYSKQTGEIAIKNYLKYSVVSGGEVILNQLLRESEKVENQELLVFVCHSLKNENKLLPTVKEFLNTIINKYEYEYDNEYEYAVTNNVTDTVTDTVAQPVTESNPKTKRKTFTPPTLEEVQAYCIERNNGVDAERFMNHYTANGWKVGRNDMKDWKATVRNWEKREFDNKSNSKPKSNTIDELHGYLEELKHDNEWSN